MGRLEERERRQGGPQTRPLRRPRARGDGAGLGWCPDPRLGREVREKEEAHSHRGEVPVLETGAKRGAGHGQEQAGPMPPPRASLGRGLRPWDSDHNATRGPAPGRHSVRSSVAGCEGQ